MRISRGVRRLFHEMRCGAAADIPQRKEKQREEKEKSGCRLYGNEAPFWHDRRHFFRRKNNVCNSFALPADMRHFPRREALIRGLTVFCAVVLLGASLLPVLRHLDEDQRLYDSFIRLHVLANSDSEADQALKLKVRDAVLSHMDAAAAGAADKEAALDALSGSLDDVRREALAVIAREGCDYDVTVTLGREYYPTRTYEGLRLPAGEYTSLRVMIGEASGKNWWCVLFPALCVNASQAREKLAEAGFTPNQIRILTESENPKYVLRFRFLEWMGELKAHFWKK